MERQLMQVLYEQAMALGKLRPRKAGQIYHDGVIVCVLLWAALNDRPIVWACQRTHWTNCPFLQLPSPATMSRRLKTIGVWLVLSQLFDLLNSQIPASVFKHIDARPLTVGGASKDRDAKRGYGAGQLVKGYKLHEIRSGTGHMEVWKLSSMNDREALVAPALIGKLTGGGYLCGDNAYDANNLFDQAAICNYQLIAPPRKSAQDLGHRKHSPHRLRSLELLANPLGCCGQKHSFGQRVLEQRRQLERDFAHEVTRGMAPLPFWVRRPHRVAGWVQAKLIICWTKRFYRNLYAA